MSSMYEAIQHVKERIEESAQGCGRDAGEIRLVAVSKTHPASYVREAYEAGLTLFGENRVQEAEKKILELEDLPIEWHLIGHLQSNKVKKAFSLFRMIHSVDRVKLIRGLEEEGEKRGEEKDILLQVNVSGEASKFGVSQKELEALLPALQEAKHLRCRGLMTIPPFLDDPEEVRPYFRALRELAEGYQSDFLAPGSRLELSMGMTNDYHVAIEEGATMVRIGTAIFGAREYA